MTRKEACYYLGIGENASDEQIKRAYRYKAKLYHPDGNPGADTKEYYIKVQRAYEYLTAHPREGQPVPGGSGKRQADSCGHTGAMPAGAGMNGNGNIYAGMYMSGMHMSGMHMSDMHMSDMRNPQNARPARVYATTAAAKASYRRQKEKEKERRKLEKWDEEYKNSKKYQQQEQPYGKPCAYRTSVAEKNEEEKILEKIRAIWLVETIKRQIELDREQKEAAQRRKLYKAFMQQQVQEEGAGSPDRHLQGFMLKK